MLHTAGGTAEVEFIGMLGVRGNGPENCSLISWSAIEWTVEDRGTEALSSPDQQRN
jgi:hypothetical protein